MPKRKKKKARRPGHQYGFGGGPARKPSAARRKVKGGRQGL